MRVRNTKPACPPTFRYYFLPISKIRKKGAEKQTNIKETFILLENISILHTSERKGWGGVINIIEIPNTQYFTSWCISITFSSDLCSPPSPSCPSLPPVHATLQCLFSRHSTSSGRSQRCRSAGSRDWGGKCLQEEEGVFKCGDCLWKE